MDRSHVGVLVLHTLLNVLDIILPLDLLPHTRSLSESKKSDIIMKIPLNIFASIMRILAASNKKIQQLKLV